MNSKTIKIGFFVLALAGAALWFGRSRSLAPLAGVPADKAERANPASSGTPVAGQVAPPLKFSLQPQAAKVTESSGNLKDQASLATTLNLFVTYHRTVLLTNEEKKEKSQLFSKAALMEAHKFLMTPEKIVTPDVNLIHQKMVDFLIQGSLQDPETVRSLAREFILDPQLDQDSMPTESRQLMAKDKAEIMFHLMAQDPKFNEEIRSANLGASAKALFIKVQEEHSRNLSESEKEVAAYKSGRW